MKNPLSDDLNHILAHTEVLWEELRGQRLFITGGTGFFGCWLLESLAWANDRLGLNIQAVVLTRNPDAFARKVPHLASHPIIRFHEGDVRTFDFPKGSFSHFIHAATEPNAMLTVEDSLLVFDTIMKGTQRTFDFAISAGAKKVLLTSSGAVYGRQPPGMFHIPEDYTGGPNPLNAKSSYGEGKRVAEMLCCLYARQYGLEAKIARCFAFVGPYLPLDAHFAVGNFIRDAMQNGPILVKGDGTPYRSYLYAADLVIWLWTILFRGKPERPYNVGSEEALTIAEVAHTVARVFDPPVAVHIAEAPAPDRITERYIPSIRQASAELGLKPLINLENAVKKSVRWYSQANMQPGKARQKR